MPQKSAQTVEAQTRRAIKKIEFSIRSIEAELAESGGDFRVRAKIRGAPYYVRVVIRARRPDKPFSWAMSILLNDQRIDGIDWESIVHDHHGKSHDCKGWHRHLWSPTAADTLKECLPKFDPHTLRDFILSGFRLLKVQLKKESRDDPNAMLWD